MDPALEYALRRGPPDRELEVAALIAGRAAPPRALRVLSVFGNVVSGRVRVDQVAEVHDDPAIVSLKASRLVRPTETIAGPGGRDSGRREPRPESGAGTVIAFLDWNCDVAHPNFRRADGRTRLRAIWDQRGPGDGNRWGYGRVFPRERIDDALANPDPYAALAYHPGSRPSHGTHVMDIAAGNGSAPGTRPGIAPGSDLVFVHLGSSLRPGQGDLGDSSRVLEALDFARSIAGEAPLVINMSLGRTAGDHTGRSIVERAMDALLEEGPGRAIVQSAGNYFGKRLHASGTLAPGDTHRLEWLIDPNDTTTNELEVWYPGRDRLSFELAGPDGSPRVRLELDQRAEVAAGGAVVGFAHHRERDPLNGDHHIDVFLEPNAPPGAWTVTLVGTDVVDGRWHAWIERDSGGPHTQSRFGADFATDDTTLGSIATGHRTLVMGAIDSSTGAPASFSSEGPSRDGRRKPDLLAPGVRIVAARSTPPGFAPGSGGGIEMSGTSMAAPHAAGTVALLFASAPRKLTIAETRVLMIRSAAPVDGDPMRTGAGLLDTDAVLIALQRMFREGKDAMPNDNETMPRESWSPVGTQEFEREIMAVFGPRGAYQVVGPPGASLEEPIRRGDLILRNDADTGPFIARVVAPGLYEPEVFPFGAESEDEGDGMYAEALERRPDGWAAGPGYRKVTDRNLVVRAGLAVLRPLSPGRPQLQLATEPTEPLGRGEEPADDSEDAPPARPSVTTVAFPDDPIVSSVTPIISSVSPENDVEALIAKLRAQIAPLGQAFAAGLHSFDAYLEFGSDTEKRPRFFEVALEDVGKMIVEHGIKLTVEKVPVVGEVFGVVRSIVTTYYEKKERASKGEKNLRIAEYLERAENQISELIDILTRQIDESHDKLVGELKARLARSRIGTGDRLIGDAAEFIIELKNAVEQFIAARPTAYKVQQLITERFIGPVSDPAYASHGERRSATLYLNMRVYHDRTASPAWKVQRVDSSWTVVTSSPRATGLANSLRASLSGQGKPTWQTNLPKVVSIRIEEEVPGFNEYYEGSIHFTADPKKYEVGDAYGKSPFDKAWNVSEIQKAALEVNDLVGSDK